MSPSGPPPRWEPAFDDAGIAAAGDHARAVWAAESGRERDRLLALPPASRLAALDDDGIRTLLTSEHRAELRASLAPAATEDHGRERTMEAWTVERRRLAVLHTSRMVAPAGIILAALLPFVLAAWRLGMGSGGALVAFLATGRGLTGVALALVVTAVLVRLVGRANSLEGLAGLGVAAFLAGVAGLAVSLGLLPATRV